MIGPVGAGEGAPMVHNRTLITSCILVVTAIFAGQTLSFGAAPLAIQTEQITQPDVPSYSNLFGSSVAVCGNWMVVGAPTDADAGSNVGAVYIFRREAQGWVFHDKLLPRGARTEDLFGSSVAINEDWLVVGAPHEHFWTYSANGTAFVFRRLGKSTPDILSDDTWVQVKKLESSSAALRDRFGTTVALTPDGVLAIGAPGVYDYVVGSVEVYRFSNWGWHHEVTLVGHDTAINDNFGEAIDVDVDTILVGASGNSEAGEHAGAAYIFNYADGQWRQVQKLLPSDREGFGYSVAIEGDVVLIGAPGASVGLRPAVGAAYLFRRQGSQWTKEQKLYIPETQSAENFGANVQLGHGIALVQAPAGYSEVVIHSISVWVNCEGNWYLQQRIKPSDVTEFEAFGVGIAIIGDEISISSGNGIRAFSIEQEFNLQSYWYFQRCYAGGTFADPGCEGFDFDKDGQITEKDYRELLTCWQP